MDFDLDAMIERGWAARQAFHDNIKQYRVKNSAPLPNGYFSVKLHEVTRYIGKARYLEESQNISRRAADICFEPESMDLSGESQRIGNIQFTIINKSRMVNCLDGDSSESFAIDCEEHSQELADMYAAFYDKDTNPRDWEMGEELQGDILYLNEIRLQPEWRGYGIGLLAIHGLLGLMPSFEMDAVILCPAGLTRDTDNKNHVAVQRKLKDYYSLLGFHDWSSPPSGTTLMGIWTGAVQPSIERASRDPTLIVVPHLF
ncbi:hypothetical protein FIBSPDRAFT_881191 [Athelia psychrophila]|uniref:Uncharacterized protein n=1 Tax=Athelia psychrophila TaxID=1759441 RepID=A0A166XEL3_9AGAM|nr:hypothetical protein FIBSPDRAFT_881191 [Fibularhizoctonia sp. CBS 109695]